MAHTNYLISAHSYSEAEHLFKNKLPYEDIDSIEKTSDIVYGAPVEIQTGEKNDD